MDEPFGALDAPTRERMGFELLRLWQGSGKTVIFVTHSISEAVLLSDRVSAPADRPARITRISTVVVPRPRSAQSLQHPELVRTSAELRQLTLLRNSPIHRIPARPCPLAALVGAHEPPEFRRQSRAFVEAWQKRGGQARYVEVAGHHHFSVIGLVAEAGNVVSDSILAFTGLIAAG